MESITGLFQLYSNHLCSDVPTQVQALSSGVTSYWAVTTDNSIGTVCGWDGTYMTDSRFPTMDGSTSTKSIDYSNDELTGTIPTELGLMTDVTFMEIDDNEFSGTIPTELGRITEVSDGLGPRFV